MLLVHFNSTTLYDICCFALVVFPDDDFATLVVRSGNHGSPPHTLVTIEILAGKNLILDAHACQFDQPGVFVPPTMLATVGQAPLRSRGNPGDVQRVLLKYATGLK